MYYTGLDPFTKKPVFIAKALRERKAQRALMQFFKPENYFEVRDALKEAGRSDLIGEGCDCLIPSKPPKEAIAKRRDDANQRFRGEYVHKIPNPASKESPLPNTQAKKGAKKERRQRGSFGYRPGRKGASDGNPS